MKRKPLIALTPLLCLLAPFFLVARQMGESASFARPIVPLEVLALAVGLCLEGSGSLRRRLHPLAFLPCAALLLLASIRLRAPMDYLAWTSSGYVEGSREGLGALRMLPGRSPLIYLFVRDDHATLYGLLSQLLLGLTAGAALGGLPHWRERRFAWRPCLALCLAACAALAADGLISWAATRTYADNWFGVTMQSGQGRPGLYSGLCLAALLATPLLSLGLGLWAGRLPALRRWARVGLSAACVALFLLGSGLFLGPYYVNPMDTARYVPYLLALFPPQAAMALETRWLPLLFLCVMPYRVLPPLLLGLLWAPAGQGLDR